MFLTALNCTHKNDKMIKNSKLKKIFRPIKNLLRTLYSIPSGRAHIVIEIRKRK